MEQTSSSGHVAGYAARSCVPSDLPSACNRSCHVPTQSLTSSTLLIYQPDVACTCVASDVAVLPLEWSTLRLPSRCAQDFSSQDAAVVTIPLTYSATTTNANLKMTNQPGYTFANMYNGCSDGFFPIDGVLLGNSYRASPLTFLIPALSRASPAAAILCL